jgi:hypothetical protein
MATSLVRFLTTSLHEYQPLSYPGYLLVYTLDPSQEQPLLILQYDDQPPQLLRSLPLLSRSKVMSILRSHGYLPTEWYMAQAIMEKATPKPMPTQIPNVIPSIYA